MGGQLRVDVESLRASASPLEQAGQQLAQALHVLSGQVTGSHSPWGSDEPGSLFGMAYVEVTNHALEVYSSMAELLVDVADGVRQMAESHAQTEQANTEQFQAQSWG